MSGLGGADYPPQVIDELENAGFDVMVTEWNSLGEAGTSPGGSIDPGPQEVISITRSIPGLRDYTIPHPPRIRVQVSNTGTPSDSRQFVQDIANKISEPQYSDQEEDLIVLIGHSLGGDTALKIAQAAPNADIDVLALLDPVGFKVNGSTTIDANRSLDVTGDLDLFPSLNTIITAELPTNADGTAGYFFDTNLTESLVPTNVRYFFNRYQTNSFMPVDYNDNGGIRQVRLASTANGANGGHQTISDQGPQDTKAFYYSPFSGDTRDLLALTRPTRIQNNLIQFNSLGLPDGIDPNFLQTNAQLHHDLPQNGAVQSQLSAVIESMDPRRQPDRFELNNSQSTATVLPKSDTISFTDLTIHDSSDVDYFSLGTTEEGVIAVELCFVADRYQDSQGNPIATPPGVNDGNLGFEILDSSGTVVATSATVSINPDVERAFAVSTGGEYFVRVLGDNGAFNLYDLKVSRLSVNAPNSVDLKPVSDTGRFNNDDITADQTLDLTIHADLRSFAAFPDLLLGASDIATDLAFQRAGAAVVQLISNSVTGQLVDVQVASRAGGVSTYLFDATTLPLADSHYIASAAIRLFDGAGGFSDTELSPPLDITLDTTAPFAPFLELAGFSDSGVEGQAGTFTDEYTSENVPAFTGSAESGSFVTLTVDDTPDGIADDTDLEIAKASTVPDGNSNPSPFSPNTHPVTWSVTSRIDLNDPFWFSRVDGIRQIGATVTDLAGNESTATFLDVFVDTQGPVVSSVAYDPSSSVFGAKASGSPTNPVDGVSITFADVPDRIHAFALTGDLKWAHSAVNEILALEVGNYRLIGDATGEVAITNVLKLVDEPNGLDAATATYRLVTSQLLPDDRYTLVVSDSITDNAGNRLDGETNTLAPTDAPILPSGDGVPGGAFQARFTVDSRAEIAVWGQGDIKVDINGNHTFDPTNADAANHDLAFELGVDTDAIFSGQFVTAGGAADGFDRLGAYGLLNGSYRWLLDFDNNGVSDHSVVSGLQINGLPIAGDFDVNRDGDEIGLFDGTTWWLDSSGNNNIESGDTTFTGNMRGLPFVGDFDGDGLDDLGTHYASTNTFYFDLTSAADGSANALDGNWDDSFVYGFSGVLERPVAADMNLDGIDDIALTNPNRDGNASFQTLEWYFLISDENQAANGTVNAILQPANAVPAGTTQTRSFSPAPLGNDLFARFGNNLSAPLLGNFDPPLEQPANVAPEITAPAVFRVAAAQLSANIGITVSDANGDALNTTARADSLEWYLDQTMGLFDTGNYHQDYFGANEKWIKDADEKWYFITETGGLYHWNGRKSATGALIATFDSSVHADPTLLTDAQQTPLPVTVAMNAGGVNVTSTDGFDAPYVVTVTTSDGLESDTALVMVESVTGTAVRLDRELKFHSTGNTWENWGGLNEKWFRDASDQWYFITPDGTVTMWAQQGGATGTEIAQLDSSFHADPNLLFRAAESSSEYQYQFKASTSDFYNWGGQEERWFQGEDNRWFYILPTGDVYRWNGSKQAAGELVGQVDAGYHDNLDSLYDVVDDVFADWTALMAL